MDRLSRLDLPENGNVEKREIMANFAKFRVSRVSHLTKKRIQTKRKKKLNEIGQFDKTDDKTRQNHVSESCPCR